MEPRSDPAQTLQKIELIDRMSDAISDFSEALSGLRDEQWRLLDEFTRPVSAPIEPARTVRRGFEYRGDVVSRRYLIDIHLTILTRLWCDFPMKREDMAEAMSSCGITRRYVSQDRASLFRMEPKGGIEKHSFEFVDGWFADKCLSARWMSHVLAAAVRAVGLKWNVDVRVFWPTNMR